MKRMLRVSLKGFVSIVAITLAGVANAASFNFNATNLGVPGGAYYNTLATSVDGIGLEIMGLTISNDGAGNISSTTAITGSGLGIYVSSTTSGNLGLRSSTGEGNNIDGGSPTDTSDPDEGLLFTFDQAVRLDYINFDSFTSSGDDFNLTVDGVSVLVDFNANDVSPLVTNVPSQFDEYNFNNIVGTEFLFWADGNSDSFRIDTLNVSTVPVPAAAWLFGSALLGMFGFTRRKKV